MQWGKRTIEEFRRASGALPGLIACSSGNSLRRTRRRTSWSSWRRSPWRPAESASSTWSTGRRPTGTTRSAAAAAHPAVFLVARVARVLELVVRKPGGLFILGHRGLFQLSANPRTRPSA